MISSVAGLLVGREVDRVEVTTEGGVGYEISIPLGVFERLPPLGEPVRLHTHLVVKEDGWQLYGFSDGFERDVFRRILLAKGVGPGLALGMLSALSAERVVRAIREKDVTLLVTIPRIGRKKAEQIVLDLADKLEDIADVRHGAQPVGETAGSSDAVRALASLGYSVTESERAVRAALDAGAQRDSVAEIVRKALAIAGGGGGR